MRSISKALGLPWWNKPAQPCLASRFPYGEEISTSKLHQVFECEQWLRLNGFNEVRVRSQGLTARIEVPNNRIDLFFHTINREKVVSFFLSMGFTSVSIDLEGLVSGKLNRDISYKRTNDI